MALVPFPGNSAVRQPEDPDLWPDDDPDQPGAKMSFLEHLDELRKRIIYSVVAIACGVGVSFLFINRLYDFVMRPLSGMLPKGSTLVYTEPTEAFVLYLKIGLLAGIVLAAPVIMWQVWLFIAPGLYANEKKFAVPFIFLSSIGFIGGAAFSHYLVFPWMWTFFASFSTEYTMFMPKIDAVFSLYMKMILGMGLVFQMPSLVFFLSKLGLVTAGFLWRNTKYAILIMFIVAAVITPSGDMMTQTMMATPMIGLYFISIVIAAVFGKGKRDTGTSE